jgi:hypothetical protein
MEKLLKQGNIAIRLKSLLLKCYGHHHNVVDHYEISISQITMNLFIFYVDGSFLYHCQDFFRTCLYICVTRRVSYQEQELLTIRQHMSSLPVFCGVRVAHPYSVLRLYPLTSVL